NERVYNNSVSIPLDDSFMDFGEKLPFYYEAKSPQQMSQSKLVIRRNSRKKIFVLFFLISNFLNKREISKFKNEIETQFSLLEAKLSVITIDEIKILMGLNFDWKSNL
ncbi:TPA: Abi family protein, partial [Enterococcus faecium]